MQCGGVSLLQKVDFKTQLWSALRSPTSEKLAQVSMNTSASFPMIGCSSTTSGTMRYHVVPTGDHLACSLPCPES